DAPSTPGADGRRDPPGIARARGRGWIGAARRLRQRREPAAGAQRGATARDRAAYRAWRPTWTAGASDADGELGARRRRRHCGLGRRGTLSSWPALARERSDPDT